MRSRFLRGQNVPVFIIVTSVILRFLFIGFNQALVEEAYYFNYAMHLDYGYLDHPPMVAFLIKLFTAILGPNEFAIRLPALLCWAGMAFFSFKLSEAIKQGSGVFALLAVSTLPFFFLQSMFMTPDLPVLLCWSAILYFLHQALVLEKYNAFYFAGLFLGLGLLSKYSIGLLGLATAIWMSIVPSARHWWGRKTTYLSLLLAFLIFSPVIYWNATHDWASFWFQSGRRISAPPEFTFHHFLGLILIFILPVGIWGFAQLFKTARAQDVKMSLINQRFIQIYTVVPLAVFGFFSLRHQIKLNWIGPTFLALVPWFAALMQTSFETASTRYYQRFLESACLLLVGYSFVMGVLMTTTPAWMYQKLFVKFIDWQGMAYTLNHVAKTVEAERGKTPTFLTLDLYNLASQLAFYQTKALKAKTIEKSYPVLGRHVVGWPSLMYAFWDKGATHHGEQVIVVSRDYSEITHNDIKKFLKPQSKIHTLWMKDPRNKTALMPIYYQVAEVV